MPSLYDTGGDHYLETSGAAGQGTKNSLTLSLMSLKYFGLECGHKKAIHVSSVTPTDTGLSLIPPRSPRYPSLDLWRGVACLAVVFFHTTLFCQNSAPGGVAGWVISLTARGWVGVPVFFVISGYCISATADSARRKQRATSDYFLRRFRRIFPPYWVCLVLTLAFAGALSFLGLGEWVRGAYRDIVLIPSVNELHPWQWMGNLTLTETWRPHLVHPGSILILGPAWTLCYEEQFYAVTGILLLVAPRRFFLGALLVSLGVIAANRLGMGSNGFFWDGRWLLFAAGVAVYYAINYAGPRGRALIVAALAAGILYDLCKLAGWISPEWGFKSVHRNEPLSAGACALLFLALHRFDAAICAATLSRPLLFCGRMCYSLYLVHYPIVLAIGHGMYLAGFRSPLQTLLLTTPLSVTASVTVAWLFHTLVERRFLNTPTWNHRAAATTLPAPAEG